MKRRGKAIKLRAKVARRVAAAEVRSARPPAKARPAPVPDLQRELNAALEQLAATSEVLRVISSSPGELQPAFQLILKNATRICEAKFGNLWLREGDKFRIVANYGGSREYRDFQLRNSLTIPDPRTAMGRAIITRKGAQIEDIRKAPIYGMKAREATIKIAKARTLVAVPMLKNDEAIGVIGIYRQEVRPFADQQIQLLTNFASQAVIAIENTRLLTELRQRTTDLAESLEQQTATSEVLQVISSSPGELEPVFHAMLESATRICEAKFGLLFRYDGEMLEFVAEMGTPPGLAEFVRQRGPFRPNPNTLLARVIRTKKVSETQDYAADAPSSPPVKFGGARSTVDVPLLKDGELVGALSIYRQEVRPFTDKQIALVENFAAQAVIAIENARLLSELRESLERQTATSEVLGVISRSKFELQPILQSVVDTAERLCRAEQTVIYRLEDGVYRFAAGHSSVPEYLEVESQTTILPGHGTVVGRAALTRQVARIDDAWTDPLYEKKDDAKLGGVRSMIGVPLMRDGEPIGAIALARGRVEPFNDREIDLVATFADQAVIAIENVRLFEAEQQRSRELAESLEQQTATSEVLRVISSSPSELGPVFQTMLANATRLCEANFGTLNLYKDGTFPVAAMHDVPPAYAEFRRLNPQFRVVDRHPLGRVAATGQVQQIFDMRLEPLYLEKDPSFVAKVERAGARTLFLVPMLKDNDVIGVITIFRQEVRPFSDKQIALVQNFAAQAVIAIENTRLLNELRQRTDDLTESLEQQTATSEVLQVISSSPGDLEPVFQTILVNAVRICAAKNATLWLYENGVFRAVARHLSSELGVVMVQPGAKTGLGRLKATKQIIHIPDYRAEPAYAERDPFAVTAVERFGVRTNLSVPMLKEGELVGAISCYRTETRPFSDKQIELIASFASQAVIAIENARLLNELRQRTDDLTESLEQQTATSEVLRVISSSPGDLQPVFESALENATRLCEANFGVLLLAEGDAFRATAIYNAPPAFAELRRREPVIRPGPMIHAAATRQPLHVSDLTEHPAFK
ncbi:MAG: GAF domain-containing protein, partial [Xanthobacteraceae bacterium]